VIWVVQPSLKKYSASHVGQITFTRNAGWDAVDAMAAQDERCLSRTAKPCGPDASMVGVKLAKISFR
jgi:hypothetical protein